MTAAELAALNALSPLDAALRYAEIGLPVFPVAPVDQATGLCKCRDGAACEQVGKHPLVKWTEMATTDPDQIRNWWGSWKPDANIGIPTGQRSGLLVVDIDRQHNGLETRKAIEEQGWAFPPTVAARTRSGGWHFVYQAPGDKRVPNTTASLAGVGDTPGIDVRGDGGYVIVAPSLRTIDPDPATGEVRFGHYAWCQQDYPLAAAPEWVVNPKERVTIHDFDGPNRFLSNFHERPFTWQGQVWPTSEHAFQAAKFDDPAQRAAVQAAKTPGHAKRLGRSLDRARAGWDDERVSVMRSILEAKFADPEMAAQLLATADAALEEGNTWGDKYWGVSGGEGRNELGAALMERRKALGGPGTPAWYRPPGVRPAQSPAGGAAHSGAGRGLGNPEKRAEAALAAEVRRVTDSNGQGRNNSLFQAAANLFEICNTGHLDESKVRSELTAAAMGVGLGEREIAQTLDAQWRRKQGVRRSGWDSSPVSDDQQGLGLRRTRTVLDVGPDHRAQGWGR